MIQGSSALTVDLHQLLIVLRALFIVLLIVYIATANGAILRLFLRLFRFSDEITEPKRRVVS